MYPNCLTVVSGVIVEEEHKINVAAKASLAVGNSEEIDLDLGLDFGGPTVAVIEPTEQEKKARAQVKQ